MSKYSPQNIVKLKQEIAQLTGEITTLIETKSSLESEQSSLRSIISSLRGELSFVNEQWGMKTQEFKKVIGKYTEQLSDILLKVKEAQDIFESISRQEVVEKIPVDSTRVVRQLSEVLEKEVSHLLDKKNETEQAVFTLENKRNELTTKLQSDEHEKKELEKLLFDIQQNLSKDTQDTLGLRAERARLELEIRNIEKREHDSRVMLKRLSEQYRAVYNQTPHTHI